jgi:nitrate reductase beta subunit
MACKSTWTFGKGQEHMWWNNVETKPHGSYPQGWDVKLLDKLGKNEWVNGVYKGKTVFEAAPEGEKQLGYMPSEKEWRFPNMNEDVTSNKFKDKADISDPIHRAHESFFYYLQRICNHCTFPTCANSCPRKVIYKRPDNGIVLIDQSRCRGYRECVGACPYGKVHYNSVTKTSEKCIACYPRVEKGLVTRCVAACVGKIRMQSWVKLPEEADPENPVDYLVHVAKVALPLYPQFGCEPNIYYIPPRWVPTQHLKMLFGPGVEHAIEKYTHPDKELLGVLQLFGTTQRIIEKFRVTDTYAIGYDLDGNELIRVPIEEPFIIRPSSRLNTT